MRAPKCHSCQRPLPIRPRVRQASFIYRFGRTLSEMFAGQFGKSFAVVAGLLGSGGGVEEKRGLQVYWGREQLRRLRQSVGDQACHSSISALVAIWHDAAVLSSGQIQVVCASHQRTHMLFSLRAWRRYTQVTRCARDYRCNNSRSNRIVKPMFPCWRRSAVRTLTPCLWPDPHVTLTPDLSCPLK